MHSAAMTLYVASQRLTSYRVCLSWPHGKRTRTDFLKYYEDEDDDDDDYSESDEE